MNAMEEAMPSCALSIHSRVEDSVEEISDNNLWECVQVVTKIKGKGRRLIFATARQECVELDQLRASWLLDTKDVLG